MARRATADGLRHVRHRLVLRLPQDHPDLALSSSASASPSPRRSKRVVRHALVQAESHIRTPGRGRGGPRRRPCRHGQHRPRPDRRPAPGRQGPGRPRRRRPAVHLVQPAVLGPPLARLLDLVPRQPVGRARVGVGRRPLRAGPASRRRVLVVGGGPAGLETARVAAERGHRRHAPRARGGAGRPVPAGRPPAVARPDPGPARRGTAGSLEALGVDVRLGTRRRPTRSPRPAPTRWSWRPGSRPARPGSSGPCRWSTGCPAWTPADVFSIHDVLDGSAVPGRRVLVLDDVDDWRGLGTALHLAERGPRGDDRRRRPPVVARGLFHSAADGPLRQRFADGRRPLDRRARPSSAGADGVATIRSTLTGASHDPRSRRAGHRRDARRRTPPSREP